ncbi:MAG: tetratricopeptide repeat protein [Thermoguttaceae bacterium]
MGIAIRRPLLLLLIAAGLTGGILGLLRWLPWDWPAGERADHDFPPSHAEEGLSGEDGGGAARPLTAEKSIAEAQCVVAELLESFSDSPEALDLAGRFHQRLGDPDKAVWYWERCLAIRPRSAHASFCIGSSAWERGDHEKAVQYLRRAREIDPGLAGVDVFLGESLMNLGRAQEAAPVLERASKTTPGPNAFFLLGQAQLQLKEYEKARSSFEAAVARDPRFSKAHYGLAQVWTRLGDAARAGREQKVFLDLHADELARGDLGRPHGQELELDEVRREAAFCCFSAARIYAARGSPEKARNLLRRTVALDAANPVYRQTLQDLGVGRE